jgi:hypothetical protein
MIVGSSGFECQHTSENKKAAEADYVPVIYYRFCRWLLLFGKPQQDGGAVYTL